MMGWKKIFELVPEGNMLNFGTITPHTPMILPKTKAIHPYSLPYFGAYLKSKFIRITPSTSYLNVLCLLASACIDNIIPLHYIRYATFFCYSLILLSFIFYFWKEILLRKFKGDVYVWLIKVDGLCVCNAFFMQQV